MTTSGLQQHGRALVLSFLGVCLVWSYWPTLGELTSRWAHDPQYSHGYLVPAFSGYLLWVQRRQLTETAGRPSWWGVVLIAFGVAMRLVGTYVFLPWLDAASLLPI